MSSCFSYLTKDITFQPNITQDGLDTSKFYPAYKRPGHDLYVFDIRHRQVFTTLQPQK